MTVSYFQITEKTNIVIWVSIYMHFIYCHFFIKIAELHKLRVDLVHIDSFSKMVCPANMT